LRRSFVFIFFALLLTPDYLPAAGVKVQFDPSRIEIGPFPTDYLTAPATNTRTARRVRLPMPPDCAAEPNTCQERWLANDFDGFALQARIRVRFSGAVNPATLADGVFLIAREKAGPGERAVHKTGDVVRLNQLSWDPATNTAYGKPDSAMDPQRRYLIAVTDAVKDEAGDPVEADEAYTACTTGGPDEYCRSLAEAVKAPGESLKIAAASLYTTMSATAWLEKAREQLSGLPSAPSFPAGARYFRIGEAVAANWRQHTRLAPNAFVDEPVPLELLQGVAGFGFGSYPSPVHLDRDRTIHASASGEELPLPALTENVHFQAWLPLAPKPEKGFPVVITGHGFAESSLVAPFFLASAFAQQRLATIAIPAAGHGFGPQSVLQVRDRVRGFVDVPVPGRGVDLNGDGRFEAGEGCAAVASSPLGMRDCLRQTAVDVLQLVRVIRNGLDIDGDGAPDFDPDRIYFAGHGLGALYGVMVVAVEPSITLAGFNSAGGSGVDIARLSPMGRPSIAQTLGLRRPSLLNRGRDFEDDIPLRNQPVKTVASSGAGEIQNVLDMMEWLQTEGDPASYAAHLKLAPLPGSTEKAVLWQFGIGDRTVANPAQSALVRLADMKNTLWVYRHDLARRVSPRMDANPHGYLTNQAFFVLPITNAVQSQMAAFFGQGPGVIQNPNAGVSRLFGVDLFELPATLPEELNFLDP
jgi:hypothetical protein